MYELKKNGKVFRSEFVGTGPSSYEKKNYRAAVSQSLRNTAVDHSAFLTLSDLEPEDERKTVVLNVGNCVCTQNHNVTSHET